VAAAGSGDRADVAPAKVNLTLHVLGRRPDGYHEIESLVAFADIGDRLTFAPDEALALDVTGPTAEAAGAGADNLVLKAAHALAERIDGLRLGRFDLDKQLPVASGIGGGSADAAATLRLLTSLWGIDPAHASAVAPRIGSDVPACLLSLPVRGEGAGDAILHGLYRSYALIGVDMTDLRFDGRDHRSWVRRSSDHQRNQRKR